MYKCMRHSYVLLALVLVVAGFARGAAADTSLSALEASLRAIASALDTIRDELGTIKSETDEVDAQLVELNARFDNGADAEQIASALDELSGAVDGIEKNLKTISGRRDKVEARLQELSGPVLATHSGKLVNILRILFRNAEQLEGAIAEGEDSIKDVRDGIRSLRKRLSNDG